MRVPEARDANRPKQILLLGLCGLVALGYFTWFFVLREDAHRESSHHAREIRSLEQKLAVFRMQGASVMEYGARARELNAEVTTMRQTVASMLIAEGLTPVELERLATAERELAELQARLAILAPPALESLKPPEPDPRRIMLRDYAKQTTGSHDVAPFGFSRDAATRIHLVEHIYPQTGKKAWFVSNEPDGRNSLRFILPEKLTPEHLFKPLSADAKATAIADLTAFQSQFAEPIEIRIETCPGIIACDAFVQQIQEICDQAGIRPSVVKADEDSPASGQMTSICQVQNSGKWFTDSGFTDAFSKLSNLSVLNIASGFSSYAPARSGQPIPTRNYGPPTIYLQIAGFPRFHDSGFASFGE